MVAADIVVSFLNIVLYFVVVIVVVFAFRILFCDLLLLHSARFCTSHSHTFRLPRRVGAANRLLSWVIVESVRDFTC